MLKKLSSLESKEIPEEPLRLPLAEWFFILSLTGLAVFLFAYAYIVRSI